MKRLEITNGWGESFILIVDNVVLFRLMKNGLRIFTQEKYWNVVVKNEDNTSRLHHFVKNAIADNEKNGYYIFEEEVEEEKKNDSDLTDLM